MQQTMYKGIILARGSKALELFQDWKSEKDSKLQKAAKAKLDKHMDEVDLRYKALVE